MDENEDFSTITDGRQKLFDAIGAIINQDHFSADVICALADHLAMAMSFVCDTQEQVEDGLEQLMPSLLNTVKANWELSRQARRAAEQLAIHAHKPGNG